MSIEEITELPTVNEKQKVFCKVKNGIGWVYLGHTEQVYKVGNNYEFLNEPEPRKFERYATSFDI